MQVHVAGPVPGEKRGYQREIETLEGQAGQHPQFVFPSTAGNGRPMSNMARPTASASRSTSAIARRVAIRI